jgi:hypothetical protein
VPQEVKMQGELYGLHVEDTPAAFSSRYHAKFNTPGIRCRVVSKADFDDAFLSDLLSRDNIDINDYQPGELVPWQGGEIFACVNSDGTAVNIHADINAAQNLQRRFWTRYAEPFRLPCNMVQENGSDIWVPRSLGKRMLGAMGGAGVLIPSGHESGSCRWDAVTLPRYKKLGGGGAAEEASSGDPDLEELEALAESLVERSGDYETFFRDPSGHVLPADLWYPSKTFWSIVKAKTSKALRT